MKQLLLMSLFFILALASTAQSLDEARKHLYYERRESAKEDLLKLIEQSEKTPPEAWYWLGEIYLDEGNLDSAQTVLEQGTKTAEARNYTVKEYPLVHIGWMHYLLDKGDSALARQQMETMIKDTRGKNALVLWAIARANIDSKHGDLEYARELLERAIRRDKRMKRAYLALGDLYRRRIDGGNAIQAYKKLETIDPGYAVAYHRQGKIYKSQKNSSVYLKEFTRAINADSTYAPALYELYNHYFFQDAGLARRYLDAYIRHAEPSIENEYMIADLDFISKKYEAAVKRASKIISIEKDSVNPRLYKMLAYCYESLGDSVKALDNIARYFEQADTVKHIAKDYELRARLLVATNNAEAATAWYAKAWESSTDAQEKIDLLNRLANMEKKAGRRGQEAHWRELIYTSKYQPSNIDIYNWGLALFAAEQFQRSDSVFGIYTEKYPDQVYGFLWRAKSNALIDTTMELGLAVPHYKKLVEVAAADPVKNKSIIISAYGYLGSYEANVTKDYEASLTWFEKLLELDPDNSDADKYASTLKKWIAEEKEAAAPGN